MNYSRFIAFYLTSVSAASNKSSKATPRDKTMTTLLATAHRFHCFLVLFCLYAMNLLSCSVAETSGHSLTVNLPRMAFVRLEVQPLSFMSNEEILTTQLIGVLSNNAWQLSASFIPCQSNDSPQLTLSTAQNGKAQTLKPYPRVFATGLPTAGWQQLTFNLGSRPFIPSTASSEGCHCRLLYTFVQP
jgi:hypothetical protein